MSNKKAEIMEAYVRLLDENPAKRITVNDIVTRCGVSRNTFYYYYADIPALISEIEARWVELICVPEGARSIFECMGPFQAYAREHCSGLLRAYREARQKHFTGMLERLWETVLRRFIETRGSAFHEEEREFLIRFFKCVFVGMTLDWLDSDMSYDLTEVGRRACELLCADDAKWNCLLDNA